MSIVDKVKQMLGQHPDKAKQGTEKAGDMLDQRTGGKYADKVDKTQDKADEYVDRTGEGGPQGGGPQGGGIGGETPPAGGQQP